jgi:hypothetical protein
MTEGSWVRGRPSNGLRQVNVRYQFDDPRFQAIEALLMRTPYKKVNVTMLQALLLGAEAMLRDAGVPVPPVPAPQGQPYPPPQGFPPSSQYPQATAPLAPPQYMPPAPQVAPQGQVAPLAPQQYPQAAPGMAPAQYPQQPQPAQPQPGQNPAGGPQPTQQDSGKGNGPPGFSNAAKSHFESWD